MKIILKGILLFFIFGVEWFLFVNSSLAADWSMQTVDYDGDVGYGSSIIVDNYGVVHISYVDHSWTENGILKYAYKIEGDIWHEEVVDNTVNVSVNTSIAFDSYNNPCISYATSNPFNLKYACKLNGVWEKEMIDRGAEGTDNKVLSIFALSIDSFNNPHIVYAVGSIGNMSIKYTYNENDVWHNELLDNVLEITNISMDIDTANNPHIVYASLYRYDIEKVYDATKNYGLKYACRIGGIWKIETIDLETVETEVLSYGEESLRTTKSFGLSDIALDHFNNPHISYTSWVLNLSVASSSSQRVTYYFKYASKLNDSWFTEDIIESMEYGEKYISRSSLDIDYSNNPHISYSYVTRVGRFGTEYDDSLGYAFKSNFFWYSEVIDNNYGVGAYNSIALDINDYSHISYYDWPNKDLKYMNLNSDISNILRINEEYTFTVDREKSAYTSKDESLTEKLLGRILLQTEENGEAWYINPVDEKKYYLGRPLDAFNIMRQTGLGITNANLNKIPSNGTEWTINQDFKKYVLGRILLQAEENGEAWYVSPVNEKKYYMGRPQDAFDLMRNLGLGISNTDLRKIEVGE